MARMPEADWLGEHSPRREMDRYDIVCVHTIVGFAPAHAAHFSTHQGGTIQQSRDTRYRSAANLNGNHRVIAIENEDHGSAFPSWSGSNVPALTSAQVEANAKILAWAHTEHGVPLQLCPDSRPGSRGLAYHRQGIDGNFGPFKYGGRVSGGENWSTSFGKVCPGDRRIDQLPAIVARAKQIVNGDDMAINDITVTAPDGNGEWHLPHILSWTARALHDMNRTPYSPADDKRWSLPHTVAWTARKTYEQGEDLDRLRSQMSALIDMQQGLDTEAVLARLDERHDEAAQQRQTIAATMTDRLDSIAAAVEGSDPAQVKIDQIRNLLGLDTDA